MKVEDVDRITRGFNYKIMLRSRHMHSVQAINALNNVLLEVKKFSYFCHHYIDIASGDCISKGYIEPWRLVTLEPCHSEDVFCDVEYDETD